MARNIRPEVDGLEPVVSYDSGIVLFREMSTAVHECYQCGTNTSDEYFATFPDDTKPLAYGYFCTIRCGERYIEMALNLARTTKYCASCERSHPWLPSGNCWDIMRVHGEVVCTTCNKPWRKHPICKSIKSGLWLRVACDGKLLHL